jgi:hypothetical protein
MPAAVRWVSATRRRARNLDAMRRIAADPARSYRYLLDSAMISSLRRSGMIR